MGDVLGVIAMIISCLVITAVINKPVRLKPKGLPEAARALVESSRCLLIYAGKLPFLFWCSASADQNGQQFPLWYEPGSDDHFPKLHLPAKLGKPSVHASAYASVNAKYAGKQIECNFQICRLLQVSRPSQVCQPYALSSLS